MTERELSDGFVTGRSEEKSLNDFFTGAFDLRAGCLSITNQDFILRAHDEYYLVFADASKPNRCL